MRATPTPDKTYYNQTDHGILLMYLEWYPETCLRVATELGYHNPPLGVELNSGPSMEEWYHSLIDNYFLANQPGGKKSGASDARIWLNTAMNPVCTIDRVVSLIQKRVSEEMAAK